jgi:uncharacterized protein (DUF2384 family)
MNHGVRARLVQRLVQARALANRLEIELLQADRDDPMLRPVLEILERVVAEGAARWWTTPAYGLNGQFPRDVALTGRFGRERVAVLLLQIEWGILS